MSSPRPFSYQEPLRQVLRVDEAILRGYCRAIEQRLEQGPLSLSDRDRLISRGMRLGLKRFDANLVLAAIEHRNLHPFRLNLTKNCDSIPSDPDSSSLPRWLAWSTALAVQGMIGIGVWWILS